MDTSQLPASYKINSAKEKMMLHIAANFRRQYTHLCPDRKELFLHPLNECGVEVRDCLGNRAPWIVWILPFLHTDYIFIHSRYGFTSDTFNREFLTVQG